MGYERFDTPGETRSGWSFNVLPTTVPNENGLQRAGLDVYFLQDDRKTFKVTVFYKPYFYVGVADAKMMDDVTQFLLRKFEVNSVTVEVADMEDLDLPNHLSGKRQQYLKLSFPNVDDLMAARMEILPVIRKKQDKEGIKDMTNSNSVSLVGKQASSFSNGYSSSAHANSLKVTANMLDCLTDIREYDVPYVVRCCIDLDIRAGQYYSATVQPDKNVELKFLKEKTASTKARTLSLPPPPPPSAHFQPTSDSPLPVLLRIQVVEPDGRV